MDHGRVVGMLDTVVGSGGSSDKTYIYLISWIVYVHIYVWLDIFTVILMNTTHNGDPRSICPEPLEELGDDDKIIEFDSYDHLLRSGGSNSCFGLKSQEHPFLHLAAHIYAPPSSDLQVTFEVSGLACMDSGLIVYRELYTKKQDGIPYQQCGLIESKYLADTMCLCAFSCDNVQNITSAVKIHVQVQRLPWVVGMDFEICNINVGPGN